MPALECGLWKPVAASMRSRLACGYPGIQRGMASRPMIEFRVLGSLGLWRAGGEEILSVLAQPKRTALLAYLAVASPRDFQRRDTLAGLFWPEGDQEHARAALRKAVHHLRRSLGEELLLNRGDEEIGLDWEQFRCDAIAFQEAIEAGDWEGALEAYRGDFLEGFFLSGCPDVERWMEGERQRLRELAAGAAWESAHHHLALGRVVEGERMGQRALSYVCTDESEARRFIAALSDVGDRAAAVRFFQRFAKALRDTLELEPSPETKALVERIRGPVVAGEEPREATHPVRRRLEAETSLEEGVGAPVDEPPSPPSVPGGLESLIRGELGPDLEVLREIGGGSGAQVFLAREKPLDRLVAVKILPRDLSRDPVARTRFEREAKAAASLGHLNAVAVHRFGWLANEAPFLVMQYVDGPTLEERVAAEGSLPVPAARKILAELASALAEAHRKGFVHRDVSPANVLWDRETDRVLLTDFGLAGLLPKREGSLPRVTKKGEVLGSPGYSSPEQLQGDDPTEGTDIYALAVLGYEILTGEGPFRAKTVPEAAAAHLRATPRPLPALRPDVDEGLADLLRRCLAKEPGKRPSAEYLAEALLKDPWTGAEEEGTSTLPGREGVLKSFLRRRFLWTLSVTGVIGVGSLAIVHMVVRLGLLPEVFFPFAIDTVLCGLAAASVVAWYHGEVGRQRVAPFEVVLLAVVGLIWVAVGIAILVP